MITCEACGREFRTHRGLDCPWCGYDNGPGEAAGDGQTGQTYTYDAWNRLVAVEEWTWTDTNEDGVFQPEEKSNPVAVAAYEYDGLGRRIQKTVGETTDDYYYNESWQVLETRRGGDPDPLDQYVWDVRYVDAPVVRFHDGNTDGDLDGGSEEGDNTLYYTTDANWNVTALVDAATGNVVERYMYDAYGKVTILDGTTGGQTDWATDADQISDVANDVLFAGYRFDAETGLYATATRIYHPTLATWLSRDAGYIDKLNLYQYCRSNPATLNDPLGTCPALPLIIILEGAEGVEIIDGVILIFDTVLLKYITDMIPTEKGTGHSTSDPSQAGPGGPGRWKNVVFFALFASGTGIWAMLALQLKTPTPSEVPPKPTQPGEPSRPPENACEPVPEGKKDPPRLGPQPWEPGQRRPSRPKLPRQGARHPQCDCPECRDERGEEVKQL